ncbi:MAG: hypothetical protein ACLPTJ_10970 [Solirubrobacteraceae bacterium]
MFLLAVPLALFAAMMAWLISYDELSRHFPDRRAAARESLRRALVTFVFFLVLGGLIALVLARAHA